MVTRRLLGGLERVIAVAILLSSAVASLAGYGTSPMDWIAAVAAPGAAHVEQPGLIARAAAHAVDRGERGLSGARLPGLHDDLGAGIGHVIDDHVAPVVRELTTTAVEAALDLTCTEEEAASVTRVAAEIRAAVTRGLATSIDEEIGPAIASGFRRDLEPALDFLISRDEVVALARRALPASSSLAAATQAAILLLLFVASVQTAASNQQSPSIPERSHGNTS